MKRRRSRLGKTVTALALVLGWGCTNTDQPSPPPALHPVIILDIDTLRADHLGCYGYARPTSPNIDALAGESVLFEWAFSQAPNTPPSQASILTSLYPTAHGLILESDRIAPRATTLAELFRAAGARTAAFVDGGYMAARFGFDRGFDSYDDNRGGGLARIGPKVLDWLARHREESFLLLVHTYDAHTPYSPREPYRSLFTAGLRPSAGFDPVPAQMEAIRASQWSDHPRALAENDLAYAIARYDGGIRMVDDWVGLLLRHLRDIGMLDRTTIVLLSDHGEEFQEHGSVLHEKLYATVTRVPLIIRSPRLRPQRITEPVAVIDVMPTLLELSGQSRPRYLHGLSLVPLMHNEPGHRRRPVLSESPYFGRERSIVRDGRRLIWRQDSSDVELYRYRVDPLEQTDLVDREPAVAQSLLATVRNWNRWLESQRLPSAPAQALDPATEAQLRALGYAR